MKQRYDELGFAGRLTLVNEVLASRNLTVESFGPVLARWLRDRGTKDFLAARLDDTPGLVNYHNRRQAMQGWCLGLGTWQELTSRLPPVPGPVQPVPDDRKRQEASAFTWARVT